MKYEKIFVECYFDKVLFSKIFGKVVHIQGKMKSLKKIRSNSLYILDYDEKKPTEDLPSVIKSKFGFKIVLDDNCVRLYKSYSHNILIILLKPDIEGFLEKFGFEIDVDTHTRNIQLLEGVLKKNKDKFEEVRKYFRKIMSIS